jgi:hypothetical protein
MFAVTVFLSTTNYAPQHINFWGISHVLTNFMWPSLFPRARIAQLVQRLATGWTVRGSIPDVGRNFPLMSRPALRPIHGYGLFHGGKPAGARPSPPNPPSSTEVKELVELYLYSFSGSPWLVLGCTSPSPSHLPFPLCSHVCQLYLFSYL